VAAQDRSDQARLDRARRIGQRLVERLDLQPPVRVGRLIQPYADVQQDAIPADCDAVVVGLTSIDVVRPLVVLERNRPERRKRFSLAHELGHILIPGHLGIEVCNTEASYYSSSLQEREAHAFASEVLMPTRWLNKIIEAANTPTDIFDAAQQANVSASAGCFAIHRLLPPGCVIALMDGANVELSLTSPGTEANRPTQGLPLDEIAVSRYAAGTGAGRFNNRIVRWWIFETSVEVPLGDDPRTASEILREIANDVYPDDARARQHALASINGIAGYAKGGYANVRAPEEMLARLRARFADRGEHRPVMDDPRFDAYLARKATELMQP
jgi:hypothetical protein